MPTTVINSRQMQTVKLTFRHTMDLRFPLREVCSSARTALIAGHGTTQNKEQSTFNIEGRMPDEYREIKWNLV
jgi:hypothetical protein